MYRLLYKPVAWSTGNRTEQSHVHPSGNHRHNAETQLPRNHLHFGPFLNTAHRKFYVRYSLNILHAAAYCLHSLIIGKLNKRVHFTSSFLPCSCKAFNSYNFSEGLMWPVLTSSTAWNTNTDKYENEKNQLFTKEMACIAIHYIDIWHFTDNTFWTNDTNLPKEEV